MEKTQKITRCPRCKSRNIEDCGKTFNCQDCNLEFDKNLLKWLENKSNLFTKEELGFLHEILFEDTKN
ncbi:MAG: hypothetical protein ACFFCV_07065 [Promethearchaeota archaeon]